jgi:Zn-dependent metalloprotease
MQRRSPSLALIVICVLLIASQGLAPQSRAASPLAVEQALLDRVARRTGGRAEVAYHGETGKVRFIGTDQQHPLAATADLRAASPEQAARSVLAEYAPLLGLGDAHKDLRLLSQHPASASRSFVRFQQTYQAIPVVGGEIIVQLNPANQVLSIGGELLPDLALDTRPGISAAAARQTALEKLAKDYGLAPDDLRASPPELWIFNPALLGGPGLRSNRLVWRMEVTHDSPGAEELREFMLVDAQLGHVALAFNKIAAAKNRIVCDKGGTRDNNTNPNDNCDQVAEYVRTEGGAASGVTDVNLAYDYSGLTYDYYFTNFGRDSIDGAGMNLVSLVRYCPAASTGQGCPYGNAYWNGVQMTYGAGYAAADDVVAHELTHGVTENSANLFYYFQAGAINESMSDVFGELVDLTDGVGNDAAGVRWQLGEDLSIGAIRNMSNPPAFGDPDRTGSANFTLDSSYVDSGGVHTNSGVNNKAAFLMVDGGTFNGQTVVGLGTAKVGQIYYEALTGLMTSGTDYQDLYYYLRQACTNLIGQFSITSTDCQQVTNAVTATEMNLTSNANGALPTEAPICTNGLAPVYAFADDMETINGAWSLAGTAGVWGYTTGYATSGVNSLYGQDLASTSNSQVQMVSNVTIPANAFLRMRHAYDFEANAGQTMFYDGGVVEYSINSGSWTIVPGAWIANTYGGTLNSTAFPAGTSVFRGRSKGYYSSRIDLNQAALIGQPVRFRFRLATDNSGSSIGWLIDDLAIYTCSAPTAVASVNAASGSGQQALVNRAFATPLSVRVRDGELNPQPGLQVTFAAPAGGAGGAFAGGALTAVVVTDAQGMAAAPTFIANATAGDYQVTATVAGWTQVARFDLRNLAARQLFLPILSR